MNGAGELYSRALLLVKPCSLSRIPLAIESVVNLIATELSINIPLSRSRTTPDLS